MDKDGTHRIYMQPLKGGESRKISGLKTSYYIAQVHSPDPGTPADVRAALMESVKGSGKLINADPGSNHGHENHGLASGLEDGLM
jgi:hypothetical protein